MTHDGRRLLSKPEPAPFFDGADGADRMMRMLLEYGPMWQAIHYDAADKMGDPDPMTWVPSVSAIPTGFMLPDTNGNARLDLHWLIPAQWDVLATTCFDSAPEELPNMEEISLHADAAALATAISLGLAPPPSEAAALPPAAASGSSQPTAAPKAAAPAQKAQPVAAEESGLALLEGGARMGQLLIGIVRAVLFEVSMASNVVRRSRG